MAQAKETKIQIPEEAPKLGPEHKRLNVFVGKWNMEGQQHEGLVGPAAKITAVETYEWLSGGFFLIHRFDGKVGDYEAACIEIIGNDPSSQSYSWRSFYNDGRTNEWRGDEREGTWMLSGHWQMAGQPMNVRCTIVFSDGGNTMTGKWEHSSDGSKWKIFWDVKAKKAEQAV